MTPVLLLIIVYMLPISLWLAYRIKVAREAENTERNPQWVAPQPDGAPGWFLARFELDRRTYMRRQIRVAAGLFAFVVWTEFLVCAAPIFCIDTLAAAMWNDPATIVWSSFLSSADFPQRLVLIGFGFFGTIGILAALGFGPDARFFRTRPLSKGFIFWARIVPVLAAVLSAAGVGMLLALGLLVAIKGPVWQHLPPLSPEMDWFSAQQYTYLLQTSAARMFLSHITTITLIFGLGTASYCVPVRNSSSSAIAPSMLALVVVVTVIWPMMLVSLADGRGWQLPRFLFLYTKIGPPPPYVFALGPITISALLLLLARRFVERIDL